MGTRKSHNPRYRRRPTPGFWIKLGLVIGLIAPMLSSRLLLLLGLIILALPAWLFEP